MHNTEDKQWWVIEYRKNEDDFVNLVAPKLGLKAEINPEKEKNPFAPDLLVKYFIKSQISMQSHLITKIM
jgi:hypothetical protein